MSSSPSSNNKSVIGAVVGTVGAIALAPVLVPAALGIIGFGGAGVIGGSIAAGAQAGIGNVVAGSLFAVAQSIGAGGAIPAVVYAAAGAMGAAAGARATHSSDSDNTNAANDRRNWDNPPYRVYRRRGAPPPSHQESCYICGNEQHDGDHCPEATNGFLIKGSNGWRGPDKEVVCVDFNRASGCQHNSCTLAHICTRCGSQRHNAQNH